MAVYDKVQRSLLGKCCLPSRGTALTQALQSIGGKVPVTLTLSTVAPGSLSPPNSCKPYFYDGYYYVFYVSAGVIYSKTSSNGETWGVAVSVATSLYHWAVMGIDNKILLVRIYDNYFKARVGTIETNHTITWGSDTNLGWSNSAFRFCWCYSTKINGSRRMYVNALGGVDYGTANMWFSDNDGDSWTYLAYCGFPGFFYVWWKQYQAIPFNVAHQIQEIYSPTSANYFINGLFRYGDSPQSCNPPVNIGTFRNEWYLGDQANTILIGSYVHCLFIDNSNNLLHKKSKGGLFGWDTVGTAKTGINADAGVTLCYDSTIAKLHIIYYEGTTIKRKIWNGSSYSVEETLVEDETDVLRLTAYPSPLNNNILLIWQDATPAIRFAIVRY